jgi:hypothetical protein
MNSSADPFLDDDADDDADDEYSNYTYPTATPTTRPTTRPTPLPGSPTLEPTFDPTSAPSRVGQINVLSTSDSANPQASDCIGGTSICNLRSAWEACISMGGAACLIVLPEEAVIVMDAGGYGSLALRQGMNVTIQGRGSSIISSSVGSSDPLIYYQEDNITTYHPTMNLYDVTIRGFGSPSTHGGAIYLSGACSVLLDSVSFVENIGAMGGAVYAANNSLGLTVHGCSFLSCSGSEGGGCYAERLSIVPLTLR